MSFSRSFATKMARPSLAIAPVATERTVNLKLLGTRRECDPGLEVEGCLPGRE